MAAPLPGLALVTLNPSRWPDTTADPDAIRPHSSRTTLRRGERYYEYDPYGQRQVFFSPGTNDPQAYAPTYISRRVTISSVEQPYGLCEFGHQGLLHDESLGLIYNRARELHIKFARFMQGDPLGYVDGMSGYEYVRSRPHLVSDWAGEISNSNWFVDTTAGTAEAKVDGASLEELVPLINPGVVGPKEKWQCLWPLTDTPTNRSHYTKKKAERCAKFDITNFLPNQSNVFHTLYLSYPGEQARVRTYTGIAKVISTNARDLSSAIRDAAGHGATPISEMIIFSHGYHSATNPAYDHLSISSGGNRSTYWYPNQLWNVSYLRKDQGEFDKAKQKKGPPVCWFSVGSSTTFAGCTTKYIASRFQSLYLRDIPATLYSRAKGTVGNLAVNSAGSLGSIISFTPWEDWPTLLSDHRGWRSYP